MGGCEYLGGLDAWLDEAEAPFLVRLAGGVA
jgi:hypothetical protein